MDKETIYNRASIRELVTASFDDASLVAFCFDYFPSVYEQFSNALTRTVKIQLLLEYCFRHGKADVLLSQLKRANPYQYKLYENNLFNHEKSLTISTQSQSEKAEDSSRALVEFVTVNDVDFSKLTPQQKEGIALGIKVTLANVLNISLSELQVIDLRAGSIKIVINIPKNVHVGLNKPIQKFLKDELGLKTIDRFSNIMEKSRRDAGFNIWAMIILAIGNFFVPGVGYLIFAIPLKDKVKRFLDKRHGSKPLGINLSKANLSEMNFMGADLYNADLREVNMSNANLQTSNLTLANLTKANLNSADLSQANLLFANLNQALLANAKLAGANLSGTNLEGADLTTADLRHVNFVGAISDTNTKWPSEFNPESEGIVIR